MEQERLTKQDHADRRECELYDLQEIGYELDWKTDYHCRVNGAMDVYPVNGKYHDLRSNSRGVITGSVFEFVKGRVGLNER